MIQIQKKRRQNHDNGIWGSSKEVPVDIMGMIGEAYSSLLQNQSQWGNNLNGNDWIKDQLQRQAFKLFDTQKVGSQIDVADLQNEQVVFLERSPAQDKLQTLLAQGQRFNDTRFPPNDESLYGHSPKDQEWSEC